MEIAAQGNGSIRERQLACSLVLWRFGPVPEFQGDLQYGKGQGSSESVLPSIRSICLHRWPQLNGWPFRPDLLTLLGVEAKFQAPHRQDIPLQLDALQHWALSFLYYHVGRFCDKSVRLYYSNLEILLD